MSGVEQASRSRRWPRVALALLLLFAVALAGLWLARKPLATRYADRFLAVRGVPARYRVADLGFGRQRLVNVVLGDPRDPDLVADWLEARTAIGRRGPYLTGVRGGHVRLRARLIKGKLSLGSLDRLLPPPSGRAFSLPALDVAVEDARVRLETPYGVAGLKVAGSGRLDGGFDGRLAVTSARLGRACAASEPRAVIHLLTVAAGPRAPAKVMLDGSAEMSGLACAGVRSGYGNLNGRGEIALGAVPFWTARADIAADRPRHQLGTARRVSGRVDLTGVAGRLGGTVDLAALDATARGLRAAKLGYRGAVGGPASGDLGMVGTLWIAGADAGEALRRLTAIEAAGTPVAPLLTALNKAFATAVSGFEGRASISYSPAGRTTSFAVTAADLRAASGVRVRFGPAAEGGAALNARAADQLLSVPTVTFDAAPGISWMNGRLFGVDAALAVEGGGLPTLRARINHDASQTRVSIAPLELAAGGAALSTAPIAVAGGGGGWRLSTTATLSGPLGDGRVDGLRLPVDARWDGRGRVTLAGGCVPVAWRRLAMSGLVLDAATLRLCPTGGALVTVGGGGLTGGAAIGPARLSGRLGSTPVTLAAAGARVRLGDRGFAVQGVQARLGQPGRVTRLDIASLEGRAAAGAIAGRFAGAGGQIGVVPLLLTDAAGQWRFTGGALTLVGGLTVSDAQTDKPRLKPLPLREVALRLAGNRIEATGAVFSPGAARKVADVRLTHDLARGTGAATFTVPGLVFDHALQPDQLTPVTYGVIADVVGTVTGEGRIDWSPAGVTSTGIFRTANADLAAAFGPVQGIAGEIRFTDLLALRSAPGQRLTVKSVNPGIAVTNGVVTFQTMPDARVQVEGARWPFAGGTLTLEPTLLDFAAAARRRLTFRVEGMAADKFLQQFDFKNLNATGVFDGEMPMVFDASGGRIENGRLTVRPGGGTVAYVGAVSQKNLGFWGNFAFDALKSLRYRALGIVMNGPLAGEMVTEVRFTGVTQGVGAKSNFIIRRLQRLPIAFNIRIRAPFRGLLDSAASFYDPQRLVGRNLPRLIDEQKRQTSSPTSIQPPASEPVP